MSFCGTHGCYGWLDTTNKSAGGGGGTGWTPGTYTKLLYDAYGVASGDWTDQVIPLTAQKKFNPVYDVSGEGTFSALKGIRMTVNTGVTSEGHFLTESITGFSITAAEHAVVQAIVKIEANQAYEAAFHDTAYATPGYVSYNITSAGGVADAYWYLKDDGGTQKVASYSHSPALVAGDYVKVRAVINRTTAKLNVYENGTNVLVDYDISGLGAFSPEKISLGAYANAVGDSPFLGVLFALKVDGGSDSSVLSINDGYE